MIQINRVMSLSSLISSDLKEGYFFPYYPSTYRTDFAIRNCQQYARYDTPPWPLEVYRTIMSFRILPVFGSEIPLLLLQEPPLSLTEHWRRWMPDYRSPVVKQIHQGLEDNAAIMTYVAVEMIPPNKHFISPDLLYKLQLKSTICSIDVPSPKNFREEGVVSFPCLVKVDQSCSGMGVSQANNQEQLTKILGKIRKDDAWTGGIVIQEMIQDILEVPSCHFYLSKSGQVEWLGTSICSFDSFSWATSTVDWQNQSYYFDLYYDEFTKPIAQFLSSHGYFGFVNYELLVTKNGNYLVDLNPRLGGSTAHIVAAKRMAGIGLLHSYVNTGVRIKSKVTQVIEKANKFNALNKSCRVMIMSADDTSGGCIINLSVFAKSEEDVENVLNEFIHYQPNGL